ncbi:hypothetical protein ACNQ1X_02950 [Mycoplasma sp. SK341A]|uniref:hypothetical protein n=1 Tax=Mycoplasma sp. SK341A TaxID=3401679 RepID=UPI003AAECFBE
MSKAKTIFCYWTPIWIQFLIGLLLCIDTTSLILYLTKHQIAFKYLTQVFSILLSLFLIFYIINCAIYPKTALRINATNYDWNREKLYFAHPFYKAICSVLLCQRTCKENKNSNLGEAESKAEIFKPTDENEIKRYFEYKDHINSKKIHHLMLYMPLVMGLLLGIILSFITVLVDTVSYSWLHITSPIIAVVLLFFLLMVVFIIKYFKSTISQGFLEISLNRIHETDLAWKVECYFTSPYRSKEYLQTIASKEFKEFI